MNVGLPYINTLPLPKNEWIYVKPKPVLCERDVTFCDTVKSLRSVRENVFSNNFFIDITDDVVDYVVDEWETWVNAPVYLVFRNREDKNRFRLHKAAKRGNDVYFYK